MQIQFFFQSESKGWVNNFLGDASIVAQFSDRNVITLEGIVSKGKSVLVYWWNTMGTVPNLHALETGPKLSHLFLLSLHNSYLLMKCFKHDGNADVA